MSKGVVRINEKYMVGDPLTDDELDLLIDTYKAIEVACERLPEFKIAQAYAWSQVTVLEGFKFHRGLK